MFLPIYYNAIIQLDLLATRFIISSNDKLQIYLLFIWSRRVVVKTIFGKGKKLYVANECNNQRYYSSLNSTPRVPLSPRLHLIVMINIQSGPVDFTPSMHKLQS
jgi:hypothetical protein